MTPTLKEDLKITFEVKAKFLFEEWQVASELIMEMLLASDFSDIKRLGELITAEKSHMEVLLNTQGNILAATRARRGFPEGLICLIRKEAWIFIVSFVSLKLILTATAMKLYRD